MNALTVALLRWFAVVLNASAALFLFASIATLLAHASRDDHARHPGRTPDLPFTPGADLLPTLSAQ